MDDKDFQEFERKVKMKDLFYIRHETRFGEWYMLLVKETHFCAACSNDLGRVLKSLENIVFEYKTRQRVLAAFENTESKGKVAPLTFEEREKYFKEHGEDYKDLIQDYVQQGIKRRLDYEKEHNRYNKIRKNKITIKPEKSDEVFSKDLNSSAKISPKMDDKGFRVKTMRKKLISVLV